MLKVAHALEICAFLISATAQVLRFLDVDITIWLLLSILAVVIYGIAYFGTLKHVENEKIKHIYFNNFLLMFIAPIFAIYKPFALGAFLGLIFISMVIACRLCRQQDGHPVPLAKKFWNRKFYMGF